MGGQHEKHNAIYMARQLSQQLVQRTSRSNLQGALCVMPGSDEAAAQPASRESKRGRKGKGLPPGSVTGAQGAVAAARCAVQAVQGQVALAADASRLLGWGPSWPAASCAACNLATELVQWTAGLPASEETGAPARRKGHFSLLLSTSCCCPKNIHTICFMSLSSESKIAFSDQIT
jgi:hypothetical protein